MKPRNQRFIIFGIHPVTEKLKQAPGEIVELLLAEGAQGFKLRGMEQEARRQGLVVRHLRRSDLDLMAPGGAHQGIVARLRPYEYQSFEEILEQVRGSSEPDCILALDGITDPGNLGALLRTAEATGVRRVLIPKDRSVRVTSTVIKASAGAAQYLEVTQVTNLRQALKILKKLGYWVAGLDAGARESVYGRTYPDRLVVVLGSEGSGIRQLLRQECDFLVSIPMKGKIASLNVSVAGAVVLYEWLRQRAGA